MQQVIIYRQENGIAAIITPTQDAIDKYGIAAVAKKDVPAGKRYAIIDAAGIPADRSMRNAWVVDDVDLNDGVGSESSVFEEVQA